MFDLIGSAVKIGSSIFGGISASNAMKKVKENLENEQGKNEAWYNRRYNEDSTQRADAQRILKKTEEGIRNRNRHAAATQAVMGGTEESVAAEKMANNEALAEATSRIAVAGDARKDAIEQQYLQRDARLVDALNEMERNRAAQSIAAANQGMQSGSNIANLV